MPNWRENLLTAGESLSLDQEGKPSTRQSSSLSRIKNPPAATGVDAKSNTGSRKATRTFDTNHQNASCGSCESKKSGYFCRETDLAADFSSFVTDSSSFADYEDRRGSYAEASELDELLQNSELKIDRVPYTQSVFYVSARSEYDESTLKSSEIYLVDAVSGSDCSTSTCDSFERCEFDCRDFEPFSDTCCCDPNAEGGCTRSPKLLDSPDFSTSPVLVQHEDDGGSNRSDMDGLDLALFEPAPAEKSEASEHLKGGPEDHSLGEEGNVCVGMLHLLMTDDVVNDEISPAAEWQPHFCVLLQDRGSLAAYRSEDMAAGSSLPRVRVDGAGRGRGPGPLRCWAAPSIAEEPATCGGDTASLQDLSMLGELKCLSLPHGSRAPRSAPEGVWPPAGPPGGVWPPAGPPGSPGFPLTPLPSPGSDTDTSYEKACRRGSGGAAPLAVPLAGPQASPSRLAAFFFSKRSLRASPLKRARSAAKLAPRAPLRSSRSHESLLSAPAACTGGVRGGSVRALHASLAGRAHCFQLHLPGPPPATRYFACGSRLERDAWINSLRASLQAEGTNNVRRTERSLRLFLLEAKGLAPKKKYYCELLLDATLYARTSSKLKTDLCFWGEVFEFSGLPHINVITVDVYREPDRKPRKRDKRFLVGSVKIPIHELTGRHQSERWHPLISETDNAPASLRVKCRYQSLEVLPMPSYTPLLNYLRDSYPQLLEYLEPVIGVKSKEEVAAALVGCVRGAGGAAAAARLLAAAAALEVRRAPHAALAFRANSLATKATEAYMKMLGETYLQETLWECVSGAMGSGPAWEVDPARGAGAGAALRRQRARLRTAATRAWSAVQASAPRFPQDLRLCFAAFRDKLHSMQREELADHLVSASVFLRFLCPAILSPSLFGITHEYPDERAARNLTLVAKALQTLANFTRFQGKEGFMEFLNDFLEEEAPNMRAFLNEISTLPIGSENLIHEEWGSGAGGAGHLDLGKQLASLHSLLADSVPRLPESVLQDLDPLPSILARISEELQETTGSQADLTVHSPASVHDNIFRFNDPTYSPCSTDTAMAHSSPLLNHSAVHINTLSSTSSSPPEDPPTPKYNNSLLSHLGIRKSPSLGIRAATLPRNNYNNITNVQNNAERYSSQYNNREHCVNLKVVQIGFDNKNSSTPSLTNKMIGSNGNINMHSSQRSVTSGSNDVFRAPFIENVVSNNDIINYNGVAREHGYLRSNSEHTNSNMPTNLDELSDLLRYADDQEAENADENHINQRISNHEIIPQTNINIISNGNPLVNHNHLNNGGSNVSISALSNVASSGYQSFATYSQSSSPVELYAGQPINNNFCEGSPAHQARRPGQGPLDNRRNNYGKNSQQRFEYERQKFGIQNFTRDTGANSPRAVPSGPLTFTNPVYHIEPGMEDRNQFANRPEDNGNIVRQLPKRSVSTTSSSSIEEEDDTTDNVETNSEGNFKNYRDRSKHPRKTSRLGDKQTKVTNTYLPQDQREALRHTKSSAESQGHRRLVSKSRSNGSECAGLGSNLSVVNSIDTKNQKPLDALEPIAPLRRTSNSRVPRTNPMLSYNVNSVAAQNNVMHFGQSDNVFSNNNNEPSTRYAGNVTRPDSNVEETNKEMYRLQISRSQKALYDRNNIDNISNSNLPRMIEKYDAANTKNVENFNGKPVGNSDYGILRVTENGYPLERNFSKTNISSSRLNEDLNRENGYPLERNYSKTNVSSTRLNEEPVESAMDQGALDREREREGLERAVRRLSLEGAAADSSSEQEDGCYHTTGRRRLPKNHRTIHQYEREIERLKCSVDMLRQKLESVELLEEPSTRGTDLADSKMKGIISRLLGVEEELRREQRAMAVALNRKQRVIERQGQRLAALGAANARLLSALHHLQPDGPGQEAPPPYLESNLVRQSEQLLNNLQSDLRPLYQDTKYQSDKLGNLQKEVFNLQKEKEQLQNRSDAQDTRYQMYNLEKSPSHQQFLQQSNQHHQIFNTDKNTNQIQPYSANQFYHEKVDNQMQNHHHLMRNSDKSASNQQLDRHQVFASEKSPLHQIYQDKTIVNLQSDDKFRYIHDNNPDGVHRNSDPLSSRHYRSQDTTAPMHHSLNRQNMNSPSQFIQPERPLLPVDGHQAVVSTQTAVYYGNP